jgi:hypothetical protein
VHAEPIFRPQLAWRSVAATDKPPLARWGHTACVSGSKLFVFGGTGNRVYGDSYIFDLGTLSSSLVPLPSSGL